jgi:putative hydrolase of the HAD superfamily
MIYLFDVYGVVYEGGRFNKALLAVMQDLRAGGAKVCLASNMASAQRILFWNALGLKGFADEIFCSGDLNVAKPEPLFYSRVSAALSVEPESIVFFDDSAANVDAARIAGWQAFLYTDVPATIKLLRLSESKQNGR